MPKFSDTRTRQPRQITFRACDVQGVHFHIGIPVPAGQQPPHAADIKTFLDDVEAGIRRGMARLLPGIAVEVIRPARPEVHLDVQLQVPADHTTPIETLRQLSGYCREIGTAAMAKVLRDMVTYMQRQRAA